MHAQLILIGLALLFISSEGAFGSDAPITFSGGKSGVALTHTEMDFYSYKVPADYEFESDEHAAITHFWLTGGNHSYIDFAVARMYLDGDVTPSLIFQPSLAAGSGFGDDTGPWGNEFVGRGVGAPVDQLGEDVASWYFDFRIPFLSSFRLTLTLPPNATGEGDPSVFCLVRGAVGVKIDIAGVSVPHGARLVLQAQYNVVLQPLDYYALLSVPSGQGVVAMTTLQVQSGTANFLEGCFRFFSPFNSTYNDSVLLSTGTEDYYNSGYYFWGASYLRLPSAGLSHFDTNDAGSVSWSAYRLHVVDPLSFHQGIRLVWRNGDTSAPDAAGENKCILETGGTVVGTPTVSTVTSYAWAYVWPDSQKKKKKQQHSTPILSED